MDKEGEIFQIQKGVKQGDPLSPNLFNVVLEEVFRHTKWKKSLAQEVRQKSDISDRRSKG